jgi:hypothetical protein
MKQKTTAQTKTPERYVVIHDHHSYDNKHREQACASYNTKLDTQFATSAFNMAIHTASRYFGEIFADFGDGVLVSQKSYRKLTQSF